MSRRLTIAATVAYLCAASGLTDHVKAQAEPPPTPKGQNASFNATWNFGSVFMGHDYKTTLPIENACRGGQMVTIKYPSEIHAESFKAAQVAASVFTPPAPVFDDVPLEGPPTVGVPGSSTIDVDMTLALSKVPPIPPQPFPIPITALCPFLTAQLVATHEQNDKCLGAVRTYTITMQLHRHDPPENGGGGGGAGGGGKKPQQNCRTLWNSHEFYPWPDGPTPQSCKPDIQQIAEDYFGRILSPVVQRDPDAWSWVPDRVEMVEMAPGQLLDAKIRAEDQIQGRPNGALAAEVRDEIRRLLIQDAKREVSIVSKTWGTLPSPVQLEEDLGSMTTSQLLEFRQHLFEKVAGGR